MRGWRAALVSAVLAVVGPLAVAPGAVGAGCTTPSCAGGTVPQYHFINVTTKRQAILWALGAIASCRNDGSTCSIQKVQSRSTTVATAFGLSVKSVSAGIDVTRIATSSTAVTCNSPKLRKRQVFRAYVVGIYKTYRIKKTYAGHTSTTSTLKARQPDKTSIRCRVEKL
jgi:hypothetical protein